jgi:hypothetical protein
VNLFERVTEGFGDKPSPMPPYKKNLYTRLANIAATSYRHHEISKQEYEAVKKAVKQALKL